MKIDIYQSGGIDSEHVKIKELNTENISEDEQAMISQLIIQSDFFQLNQQELATAGIGDDSPEYEIAIDDSSNRASVRFVKSASTEQLNGLLEYILSLE